MPTIDIVQLIVNQRQRKREQWRSQNEVEDEEVIAPLYQT